MNMVENIRRIGIFMIAAQTLIHFAAGKQYEKYLKIISGVIILIQFIAPFVSYSGDFAVKWQAEIEQLEKRMERQSDMWQEIPSSVSPAETVALQQIEEEVKTRLNDMISGYDCIVADVEIDLEQANNESGVEKGNHSWIFRRVIVTVQGASEDSSRDEYDGRDIRIEEIAVRHNVMVDTEQSDRQARDAKTWEYRHLFAQTLGIAEERVEVVYRGE